MYILPTHPLNYWHLNSWFRIFMTETNLKELKKVNPDQFFFFKKYVVNIYFTVNYNAIIKLNNNFYIY